jgi:hypothetical protein
LCACATGTRLVPAHEVELNNAATHSWTKTKKCDRCRQHTSNQHGLGSTGATCLGGAHLYRLGRVDVRPSSPRLPYVIVIAGCRPGSTGAISGQARCCRSWSDPPGADPLLPTTSAVL